MMATRRLLAGGATRLAFLGETTAIEIADRLAGVRDAIAGRDVSLLHLPCHLSYELMASEVEEQLSRHADRIDGIVAASDLIAMTALQVLDGLGKAVPKDIQIVGFDDLPLAARTMPPLTTIRQDIAAGAHSMVSRLEAAIAGNEIQPLVSAPVLIERETTR
jgi:DNA-binding LacI/PurR family transcriptional regulator